MILRRRSPIRLGGNSFVALVVAMALVVAFPAVQYAHDIPSRVSVLTFIKPEAGRLRIILRAPLEAMRDVNFPVTGPGYLDVEKTAPLLKDAAKVWIADGLELYAGGARLAQPRIVHARLSIPSDRSFTSFDSAATHVAAELPNDTQLLWKQAMIDVEMEVPIADANARFSINPTLARLGVRTNTVLRFLPASGGERDFEYIGDPGVVVLDPAWYQAAFRFVALGFEHILDGIDHLLFIFCLVIPFRKIRPLVAIITSFTVAHSITLIASAVGMFPDGLWFPPLIEVLIALSIVYMALENIVGPKLERRWLVAFGFGLVHGFGFSFALRESMQFAGSHLATSLVSFNIGVELGQLFVLALTIPALTLLFRRVVAERMGTIILSAFVAHTAWHWMLDRFALLREYQFTMPGLTLSAAASAARGLMLILIVAGAGWAMFEVVGRLQRGAAGASPLPGLARGDE
ncbi:MAG TPA: HupE/UreJ family protein [Gemmatimonadaceae bacterium]